MTSLQIDGFLAFHIEHCFINISQVLNYRFKETLFDKLLFKEIIKYKWAVLMKVSNFPLDKLWCDFIRPKNIIADEKVKLLLAIV